MDRRLRLRLEGRLSALDQCKTLWFFGWLCIPETLSLD